MPKPGLDCQRCANAFRLAVPERAGRGRAGDRLGRGTGASLEFQDRRLYAAGDDVRHLDWRTMARTEQEWIRVYREEISPRVEVLLDTSRSMASTVDKAQRAVDLTCLLVNMARAEGFQAQLVLLGDRSAPFDVMAFNAQGTEFTSARPLQVGMDESLSWLSPGSLRYVVSDFLSPHDAPGLTRPIAGHAGCLGMIQVLSQDDAAPPVDVAAHLTDCETGEELDLVLDADTVGQYRERLARLADALDIECRRAHGLFISVRAEDALETICRERLLTAGLLTAAG